MLSPEYLFNCSDKIVELYEELNTFAINDICRRLVNTDFRLSGSIEWQYRMLQEAGLSRQEVNKRIAEINKKSEEEVMALFEESSYKSYNADMKVYKEAGLTPLPFGQSPTMLSILQGVYENTNGTLRNLTRTTANASQQLLIDTMSEMQFRVSSGQQSYAQAIKQAVDKISANGLKVFYKGMERNLESVVRTAVLTGVNQASAKVMLQTAREMDCDTVLTTAHLGARTGDGYKGHVNWQGKVYSINGLSYPEEENRIGYKIEKLSDATGYGLVDGLCGANCRHNMRPWIVGYSTNPYMDEKGHSKIDTDRSNRMYEEQQEQRSMEHSIRNTKRRLQGLQSSINNCRETDVKEILQNDYDRVAMMLKQKTDAYKVYSFSHAIPTQTDRLQIANWSHSEARKAYNGAVRYAKS